LISKHVVKVNGGLFFIDGHELVGAEVGAERVLRNVPPGRSVHARGRLRDLEDQLRATTAAVDRWAHLGEAEAC
jgi:hypothetical protein